MQNSKQTNYGEAIRDGFAWLMKNDSRVFAIGQGLWSPWYVGNSMTNLEKEFGKERVLDTPVSEAACTGAAIGAAICGYRPIVVHPRVDFMLLAVDQIVNQAAKWSYMLGGRARAPVTVRAIVNRGGEQGAQHSQALHSWFAHIPGLRVVMPACPSDARDLLIASVLCDDPVLYIDDRWLYDLTEELAPPSPVALSKQGPKRKQSGEDVTLVAASYSVRLCMDAAAILRQRGISCDVWDLRVVNPLDLTSIITSVARTRRLCVVDGGWQSCGLAGEVIAGICEHLPVNTLRSKPLRLTLPPCPAPTSVSLEKAYYLDPERAANIIEKMVA